MSRNYQRKDPGVWNREPFEVLPNRPTKQAITVLHDDAGHAFVIDQEIDHLFHPNLRRHVWSEDGTVYTEIYDSGHNGAQEQKAHKMQLSAFVWEVWNVSPLPGNTRGFVHNNGDHRDFRIANLTRIRRERSAS